MPPVVEFRGISKQFGSVRANADVSFKVRKGSIHGIVGENGAGKSTLMSILYGYYQADAGQILLNGEPAPIRHSQDAIRRGIGMIHQHFMLVDSFTVLENIMLGVEGALVLGTKFRDAAERLREIGRRYRLEVDPDARVDQLSVGAQQRVEILKLIYRGADIMILDEPTAVLTPQEADALFAILRVFRDQGKTIILITHKLQEIFALTDRVTVMRAGRVAGEVDTARSSREAVAGLMIGRAIETTLPRKPHQPGEVVLEATRLTLDGGTSGKGANGAHGVRLLDELSFSVRAGEIVAIAGVSGNGQSELLEVLAGLRLPTGGKLRYLGAPLPPPGQRSADGLPAHYRRLGIAHAPEDRLRDGLVKDHSVALNTILGHQDDAAFNRRGLLDPRAIAAHAGRLIGEFDVCPADASLRLGLLSGGNQQKVVLGREIAARPKLMLIGQPTRGVDIGSIEPIHRRLLALRDEGIAIVLVSVELEEIRVLADRILVMCGGRLTGELAARDFDTTRIGLMMGGVHQVVTA
ncbi:MAG: heme transporter ATP-binding protein [Rhodoferax sp.]|nr:heme transporter ATP-binding protein [Rhodoferax sp.]